MKRFYIIVLVFSAGVIFTACSNTRKLPPGESLYVGASIKVEAPDLKKGERSAIKSRLSPLTRPNPNKKILGVRFKLAMYNLAGNPKKRKSPRGWLKYTVGEPPVLLSDVNLDHNQKVLESTMQNVGYFKAQTFADTVVKKRKATAVYTVRPGHQYKIDSIFFDKDSAQVLKTIDSSSVNTFFKRDDPFDLSIVKLERDRIDNYLKERGFYYFDPDYVRVRVDSTIGAEKVNLYVSTKPQTPDIAKQVYYINDVFIFPTYQLSSPSGDTLKKNAKLYDGYYVVDRRNRYKPRMFREAMRFSPGDVYSRTDQNTSLNRLVNLGVFKFVKNRFEVVPRADSTQLDAYYYLTPLQKKSLRAEVNGSTKSNNLTGSSLTLGWRNRNTFRGGELLSIDATGGFEVQFSGNFRGYNTYRAGAEANLAFPRFIVPFFRLNTSSAYVPRTNIKLGYDMLTKNKLYTLNSFRAEFGYVWKENLYKEHTLNPIAINYVQPIKVTQIYIDSAKEQPILNKAIEKQFIVGSNYNFNYNQLQNDRKTGLYFNANLDLSGNILGLVTGADEKAGKVKNIFNAQFSQYVKTEFDLRYYLKVGATTNTLLANRIIVGIGVPYGNSRELPYVKQFFVGGTNSIRAFRSRSLGPGSYRDPNTTNASFADQSGDMKLELNTELRAKLFGPIYGAVFIDAGNIWLYNESVDTVPRPGVKFTKDFYKELAVGGGVGLRVDVSILVIRLDLAIPLRKPWLPEKDRWVINQIDFTSPAWRKDNLILNLGIGYPF